MIFAIKIQEIDLKSDFGYILDNNFGDANIQGLIGCFYYFSGRIGRLLVSTRCHKRDLDHIETRDGGH